MGFVMRNRLKGFLLRFGLAAAVLGVVAPVQAQGVTTGAITGVVVDESGAVVPGATVVALHGPTGTEQTTVSGSDGRLRHFMPEDALVRHETASAWLAKQLAQPFDGKTVVVTHHGPDLGSLDPRYSHDLVSGGFLSRRPDLVAQANLWIHGHTHTSFDYCIDDSRVVCNPRGYVSRRTGEPENRYFDWCCVIDI